MQSPPSLTRLFRRPVIPRRFSASRSAPKPGAWLAEHNTSPQAGPQIPPNVSPRHRRIIHRARQRGWLELDILFGGWAAKHVPQLAAERDLALVEDLLTADTPDVLKWVLRQADPPPRFDTRVMESLRRYAGDGEAAADR